MKCNIGSPTAVTSSPKNESGHLTKPHAQRANVSAPLGGLIRIVRKAIVNV